MLHLTHQPIDINPLIAQSHSAKTGAVVIFSGEIRGLNKNKEVVHLEYEAYEPMAEKEIEAIVCQAIEKYNLNHALCIHRLGQLQITDCAVVVITCSAHRDDAYKANRFIIDKVKATVPIWKRELFADGTSEWGANDCDCAHERHSS